MYAGAAPWIFTSPSDRALLPTVLAARPSAANSCALDTAWVMRRKIWPYHLNGRLTNREQRGVGGVEVDHRARHRRTGLVDPRPQLGVAAVEVTELVGDDRLHLRDVEQLHQGQSQTHHPLAAEAHEATALGDERVDVAHQVDVLGHGLPGGLGHRADHVEELRLGVGRELGPRRLEAVDARQDRPEDHESTDDAEERELDVDAPDREDLDERKQEEEARDAQCHHVEADEQRHGQRSASCERTRSHHTLLLGRNIVRSNAMELLQPLDHLIFWVRDLGNRESWAFDRTFGTSTAWFDLGNYEPTLPSVVDDVLRTLDVHEPDWTFVDLGCGKGRVALLASQRPFRRVVGIERRAALVRVAQRNLDIWGDNAICPVFFFAGDAATHPLPQGPLVVYLFNPFAIDILRKVLLRLRNRPVRLIYVNPLHGDELERHGFEEAAHGGEGIWLWTIYRRD